MGQLNLFFYGATGLPPLEVVGDVRLELDAEMVDFPLDIFSSMADSIINFIVGVNSFGWLASSISASLT